MKVIATVNAPAAVGSYSQACDTGEFVFLSGAIPIDPQSGEVVKGGITEQAHMVFKNVSAVLEAAGLDFSNVCKTTVFIDNMDNFAAVNAVYSDYFKEPYPARSCVEVSKLPKGVMIECECIAKR